MSSMPGPAPDATTEVDAATLDRGAFDKTAAMRAAVKVDDLPSYGLDAFYAAGIALRTVPKIAKLRDDLRTLPKYDVAHFDWFDDLARALRFVQTEILRRIQRSAQLPQVATEGWKIRSLMMSYAETLSHKGAFAPELIVRLREGSGYRDLVEDLSVLVREFQGLPESKIGEDTAVTRADLTRASQIAHQINVQVGGDVGAETQDELITERRKLGGLLLEAHSQIRRGVSFFKWAEADLNALVPSLYVPAGPRRPRDTDTDVPKELAELHNQLHAAQAAEASVDLHAPVDAEDNPFTAE